MLSGGRPQSLLVRELRERIHCVLNDWSASRTWCDTQEVFERLSILAYSWLKTCSEVRHF